MYHPPFDAQSIPYKPNACKKGNECYMWDAGESVTPLWYKSKPGQWYWTPHKSATKRARSDFKDWHPTTTLKVSGWGFMALMQRVGLSDVSAVGWRCSSTQCLCP